MDYGPSHYFSAPALSWDVMLNMTKTELELITDRDVNSLHGCEISKFLPTTAFKWINSKEFDLNKYTSISSKACVFEVDSKQFQYKGNQTMKFGELIEHNTRNIFLQKLCGK